MTGISDTEVVDLVTRKGDVVKLIMIEDRKWDSDENMYYELQDKLSNYITYIENGQLYDDYPDVKKCNRVIQLDTIYEPSETAMDIIDSIRQVLGDRDIGFELHRLSASRGQNT